MVNRLEGKFRLRKSESCSVMDTEVTYYGLYDTKWDALHACLRRAEQDSRGYEKGPMFCLAPAVDCDESGELDGFKVDLGDDYETCITYKVCDAH